MGTHTHTLNNTHPPALIPHYLYRTYLHAYEHTSTCRHSLSYTFSCTHSLSNTLAIGAHEVFVLEYLTLCTNASPRHMMLHLHTHQQAKYNSSPFTSRPKGPSPRGLMGSCKVATVMIVASSRRLRRFESSRGPTGEGRCLWGIRAGRPCCLLLNRNVMALDSWHLTDTQQQYLLMCIFNMSEYYKTRTIGITCAQHHDGKFKTRRQ